MTGVCTANGADDPPAGKTRTRAALALVVAEHAHELPARAREHWSVLGFCSIIALKRRQGPVTALFAGLANLNASSRRRLAGRSSAR